MTTYFLDTWVLYMSHISKVPTCIIELLFLLAAAADLTRLLNLLLNNNTLGKVGQVGLFVHEQNIRAVPFIPASYKPNCHF